MPGFVTGYKKRAWLSKIKMLLFFCLKPLLDDVPFWNAEMFISDDLLWVLTRWLWEGAQFILGHNPRRFSKTGFKRKLSNILTDSQDHCQDAVNLNLIYLQKTQGHRSRLSSNSYRYNQGRISFFQLLSSLSFHNLDVSLAVINDTSGKIGMQDIRNSYSWDLK